jgi:RimJ/RimL family protein N-acetyltransferase
VCLEDSVTSAAARGRGIAPAAWGAIADTLALEGQRKMITKVTVENTASRRAVTKSGFEEIALMHFRRRGPIHRTSIQVLDVNRGAFFAQSFS